MKDLFEFIDNLTFAILQISITVSFLWLLAYGIYHATKIIGAM